MTPMMRQYLATKQQYPDCIMLYRLGDFYEMFFEDAIKASEVLDLVLTGRDCGQLERAPMCGIPHHAAEGYIAKLIENNFKVAVCEQLTEPSAKSIVERGVVRVITPGTVTDSEMLDAQQNNFLAGIAITDDSAAVAWSDVSTGDFFVTEFDGEESVAKLFSQLIAISPREIICDKRAEKFNETALVRQGMLPRFNFYQGFNFKHETAKELICNQFSISNFKSFGYSEASISALASGLLLCYFQETQKRSLSHIKPPQVREASEFMKLDANTKSHLELFISNHDRKRRGSLIWLIDQTSTAMGSRQLHNWMSYPLQSKAEIDKRHDAVDELVNNFLFRETLKDALRPVKDLERLCAKISCDRLSPRDCNALQQSIAALPAIRSHLSSAKAASLKNLQTEFVDLSAADELLKNAIVENAPPTARDGMFICDGFHADLDNCRNLSRNSKQMLAALENKERESSGIKNLKIGYNRVFGYYFEVTNSFKNLVPLHFMRKQTLVNAERYITDELKNLEESILGAEERALKIEKDIFAEIRDTLLTYIPKLQQAATAIAKTDCLLSFAVVAVNNNFCRPSINETESLNIEGGRHPIVEHFLKKGSYVPNDALMDTDENRAIVLTGPNMAGKSTFMRQVALIAYLAHIGCFVPAKSADIPIIDQIFTRVGASDDLAFSQSTFMVEMSEVAYILNNATRKSLIVLDEVGRGTATFDGLSIAWAVLEYLASDVRAKTLFATHFHELTELEGKIEGVKNYKISVREYDGNIVFLYKIARGGASKSFGIAVAGLAGVNKTVLDNAKQILTKLENSEINFSATENQSNMLADENAIAIKNILRDININRVTPLDAMQILADLSQKAKEQ